MKSILCQPLVVLMCFLFFQPALCFAESAAKAVRKGNRMYREKKYDEAIKDYNEARIAKPNSDIVNFDAGAALYKKGDYEKAVDSFTKALLTEDTAFESCANYNIGNSKYRQSELKENTDLKAAIALCRQSLDYYKRAIELNENDKDAKYNHEFVEKKLKALLDKLKRQQKQQKKKKKQEEQQKKQKQKGKEKKKEPEKSKDKKKGEEQKKQQPKDKGGAKPGEKKKEKQPAEKKEEKARVKPRKMSEEEARMLLEAYGKEEAGKTSDKRKSRYYPEVLKDW